MTIQLMCTLAPWGRVEMEIVLVVHALLFVVPVGLIVVFGWFLYRSFNLEGLLWVAAHYLIAPFTDYAVHLLASQAKQPLIAIPLTGFSIASGSYALTATIGELIRIIIVLLVLGEVVFLASQARPDVAFLGKRYLLKVHDSPK